MSDQPATAAFADRVVLTIEIDGDSLKDVVNRLYDLAARLDEDGRTLPVQMVGGHHIVTARQRLGCRCPDPLREVHPACPWHGHLEPASVADVDRRQLIPDEIRDRMADVERPSTIARIAGYAAPAVDAVTGELRPQGPPPLVAGVDIGHSPPTEVVIRKAGSDRDGVVRPAGLVWSGIRVDELPRMYEVLDATHEACPVPLYSGEIYGQPTTGRIFVWSIADFNRLADLSARLHRLRKSKTIDPAVIRELRPVLQLIEADAESVRIVRALERAT